MRIQLDSNVASYSKLFPVTFQSAVGAAMFDTQGRRYIDFFCGAGALSYGHNHPEMKAALLAYIGTDGPAMSLDMFSVAREQFLSTFDRLVFRPRDYRYRMQLAGPTGANGIEAALKLARKVTGRRNVISFSRSYHGLSLGALAVTAHGRHRDLRYVPDHGVTFMPYESYPTPEFDSASYLNHLLSDRNSGIDPPAAILLETVQAEGGVHVASPEWLQAVAGAARTSGALLIVDDIQVGCGRTGDFFSFEQAGIAPDMVVCSKALSGFGLPLSVLLIQPEYDAWAAGEHTGTFRGNNHAFVTARVALELWNRGLGRTVRQRHDELVTLLNALHLEHPRAVIDTRVRGLIAGIQLASPGAATSVAAACFERGLLVEACGARDDVIKLLPPFVVSTEGLAEGLHILRHAIVSVLDEPVTVHQAHGDR